MLEQLDATWNRYRELEQLLVAPEVLADPGRYTQVAKEHGSLAKVATKYGQYRDLARQIEEAEQLLASERDEEMRSMVQAELQSLTQRRTAVAEDLKRLLVDEEVGNYASIIVEVRAGTGGDEAALFARDLYEMYTRFAQRRGWKTEVLELSPTELGGFREVAFSITGEGAYRQLRFESGGHRVQRVPETETKGRRQTSLATVAIMPEPTEVEIHIRPEDLHVDTMRSGGPGGQHQNKTESGVRITHLPTGIVVNCRDEKSQHKNRAKALRVLRSRLLDRMLDEERAKRDAQRRSLIGSGDRSQRIRTYNFPENRVSDHRINLNLYQLDSIMAGNMDDLVQALIEHDYRDQLEER